jgi:hypothetical protein
LKNQTRETPVEALPDTQDMDVNVNHDILPSPEITLTTSTGKTVWQT